MAKLMRALVYDKVVNGVVTLKQVQLPIPSPSKDEVLVKLEAVALNPVDWKASKIKVLMRQLSARNTPPIPTTDVAGEVVEVGPGVKKFEPGDKVVSILSFIGGGLSEYVVTKTATTALRHPQVSAAEAAGLCVAGLTAHLALIKFSKLDLNPNSTQPQKNVLITAASGGVGHYAVQLAKLANAHVTATCGARNIDIVKGLGADEVIDYKTPQGASLKSPSGKKYDVVVHCAPAIAWSVFEQNLSENGFVVDLTPGPSAVWTFLVKILTFSKKKLWPIALLPKDDKGLKVLVGLVKEGKLKTVIDSKYTFSNIDEGWSRVVSGHATGKVIIEP